MGITHISEREIEAVASQILERNVEPVIRLRLRRDILGQKEPGGKLLSIRRAVDRSRNIGILRDERSADGGWGAFHSASPAPGKKIVSTEAGVRRALALGLEKSHPVLRQARAYILDMLQGKEEYPDYNEKNDRWPTGRRLFLASTLALIDPANTVLDKDRKLWREIALRTFQSGRYSADDEDNAHRELTGASVKNSYLVINNRYALNILGSAKELLPRHIERLLVQWLFGRPDGIGYLETSLGRPPSAGNPGQLDRWFSSLELLSNSFPSWIEYGKGAIDWIWGRRGDNGYWDFGPRSRNSIFLPLSDNWRAGVNRQIDWTLRALLLLHKYCVACRCNKGK
ncbi:MAG: hypothetical protein A2W25_10450 [candidate division Zixibacteria bacterium RBG_16_53_22]|nr:MAG: hypothetical protein A2W25_10450 [candidate division Zixibacteria bacterium RBG_16_53_22]